MPKTYLFDPETFLSLEIDDSTNPPTETLYNPYNGEPLPRTDEFPIPWGPGRWSWVSVSEETFRKIPAMFRDRRISVAKSARDPGAPPSAESAQP